MQLSGTGSATQHMTLLWLPMVDEPGAASQGGDLYELAETLQPARDLAFAFAAA